MIDGWTNKLELLFGGFEALYQIRTGLRVSDVLVATPADGPREMLVFREADEQTMELGLAFGQPTLDHLAALSLDEALSDDALADTLPVLEGLSHLAYVAEAARCERPISGLELETQAEVDKLAICLLHRWPPTPRQYEALVDRLYYRFEWTDFGTEHRGRYEQANRVAASFARHIRPHVESLRIGDLRSLLREFWGASMSRKRAFAQAR